jgi:hypothetical protein
MVVGILIVSVLLLALVVSVGLVVRDMRRLHRAGKSLADAPNDAAGVSPAGMVFVGTNLTH